MSRLSHMSATSWCPLGFALMVSIAIKLKVGCHLTVAGQPSETQAWIKHTESSSVLLSAEKLTTPTWIQGTQIPPSLSLSAWSCIRKSCIYRRIRSATFFKKKIKHVFLYVAVTVDDQLGISNYLQYKLNYYYLKYKKYFIMYDVEFTYILILKMCWAPATALLLLRDSLFNVGKRQMFSKQCSN